MAGTSDLKDLLLMGAVGYVVWKFAKVELPDMPEWPDPPDWSALLNSLKDGLTPDPRGGVFEPEESPFSGGYVPPIIDVVVDPSTGKIPIYSPIGESVVTPSGVYFPLTSGTFTTDLNARAYQPWLNPDQGPATEMMKLLKPPMPTPRGGIVVDGDFVVDIMPTPRYESTSSYPKRGTYTPPVIYDPNPPRHNPGGDVISGNPWNVDIWGN
jgi:hypothetical protein